MGEKTLNAYNQEIELTPEQMACVKYTGDRTLLVKGLAGSGKSVVLMEIAKKLLLKYGKTAQNKIALFTYQNTLVSAMRELLQVNGQSETGVVVSTVNSYIKGIYDSWVRSGAAPRKKYLNDDDNGNEQRIINVKKALSGHKTKYGKHRFHDLDPEFWLEEFDWMKNMNVWKDDLDYYLTLPRKGRGSNVRMSPSDRVTAYQIYMYYCDYLDKTGQGDWADQTLFLVRHSELIPENKKFEYVLVDEAQDLSLAQMTAILRLYKTNMIVAMDMNQKIHNRYWTPKLLGIESTTKKLTQSMRTTKQIEALAESVRSKNDEILADDDKGQRAIPIADGEIPVIAHLDSQAAERKYVVNLVKQYIKGNPKLTIGIIAAKRKQLYVYSDWFASEGIRHEKVSKDSTFSVAKPGVKIVTAYGAKGLEFDVVIIPMFAEGNFPFNYRTDDPEAMEEYIIKMRNLVYVSMTRAKRQLTITFWGNKGSRFLAEMDTDLYELDGEPFNVSKKSYYTGETSKTSKEGLTDYSSLKEDTGKKGKTEIVSEGESLVEYLESKGLEVIDKREKGGALWVVGDKGLDLIIKESRKLFGALWTYSERGGSATKHRSGWYTKSTK